MTIVGEKSLKMSSGKIRHFKSKRKMLDFEKVARAYKHGWKGPSGKGKHHSPPTNPKFDNPDRY